ncbi:MAG: tRNA dihydrouridine synthase DusB [Deltaproteobacteria bacterium]|nr:tRNA dihydrouridine synthase DusB [Deltaproteobacteria bacterium]
MTAQRFSIGGVTVAPNLVLAPMSGITDSAYRSFVKEQNADAVGLVVTELISIEALTRRNVRTRDMMRFRPLERPISIQLFGADPVRMAESARMAEDLGADIVDVNCGCPAPKVTKKGGGAELMRRPAVLREVLGALRRALEIPFTVKIRAGWDEGSRNAVEVARLAEGEGAQAIAVHGRTRAQLYSGESDWELVAQVKQAVRVPVIGSGDVTSAAGALARFAETGVDGIMVGRATLAHPWIFREIEALQRGFPTAPPTPAERIAAVDKMIARLEEELPPKAALGRSRGLACRMVKHLRGGAELRAALTRAPTTAAMRALLAAAGSLVYESAA